MPTVSSKAVDVIKQFEGFRAKAYRDQGGVWTVGYGTTGPRVNKDTVMTEAEAEGAVQHTVDAIEKLLLGVLHVPVTDNQMAALCSFAYNAGTSALLRSTLLSKLNQGDEQGAADEFLKWVFVKGKTNTGLQNRRQAERALFLKA
ncbi:MAG: lysozyme [Hymenobacter sp.]